MKEFLEIVMANATGTLLVAVILAVVIIAAVLYRLLKPATSYMIEKIDKLDEVCDKVLVLDAQNEGRKSFSDTLEAHEIRLTVIEKTAKDIQEDVREIAKDTRTIFNIVDRRKVQRPVEVDRRGNG